MRKAAVNTFTDGLMMDANPLITAQSCLTDCLNGTLITYNGNEFTLQNDMGNVKLEKAKLPDGFVPIGMKEYGGIIYMTLLNPVTNECEIGSMPSPSYETQPTDRGEGNDTVDISSESMINDGVFNDYFIKLFEFEQLTLNPGDMYGIAYQVTSGIDPIKSKNVYNVELYAVDKDNKQHKIDDPTFLNKIAVGNEDYVYMDKAVSAVLGLKISLQEIDWFESVVYEKDKDIILKLNWANKLQDASTTDDDIYISGVRMIYNGEKDNALYLKTNDISSEKVKENLTISAESQPELYKLLYKEGETLELELTPYDQFHYIDALTRKLSVTLGKDYVYDSSTATFKYKYSKSNKSLRIDFTMNTINMVDPYLYVEFYDVWSDYSVLMPVEDINPAGLNTLFIDIVNEPIDFNDENGGVDPDLLTTWEPTSERSVNNIYQPILSDRIRIKQLLRENNLYLVRMAAIDNNIEDLGVRPEAKQYTSEYKLLVINENYNSWYDKLNDIGKTTGVDFNTQNLNTTYTFDFDAQLNGSAGEPTKTVEDKLTCKYNGNYYSFSEGVQVDYKSQSYIENYNTQAEYVLSTDIKSSSVPFGYMQSITTGLKDIDDSKVYITDTDSDVTSEKSISKITGVVGKEGINISLSTKRSISASISEEQKDNKVETREPYKLRTKWSKTDATVYPAIYGYRHSGQRYVQYLARYVNVDETLYDSKDADKFYFIDADCPNETNLLEVMNYELRGPNYQYFLGEEVDAFSIDLDKKTNWGNIDTKLEFESTSSTVWSGEPWALMLRSSANGAVIVKFDNTSEVIRALDDIYAVPVEDKTFYLYTYDEVESSASSTTELVGSIKLDLVSNATVVQKVKNKIYSTKDEVIYALNSLIKDKEKIDKPSLSEDYIDLKTPEIKSEITLDIPEISITASSDKTVYNSLIKSSETIKKQQPELFISSEHENMIPYSASGEYTNQAKRFVCSIVNNNCRFTYKPKDLAKTKWNVPKVDDKDGPYVDKTLFDQL
jgi:hypothetical protein